MTPQDMGMDGDRSAARLVRVNLPSSLPSELTCSPHLSHYSPQSSLASSLTCHVSPLCALLLHPRQAPPLSSLCALFFRPLMSPLFPLFSLAPSLFLDAHILPSACHGHAGLQAVRESRFFHQRDNQLVYCCVMQLNALASKALHHE